MALSEVSLPAPTPPCPSGLAAQVCRAQVNKNSFKGSFLFPACRSKREKGCSSFDSKMPFLTPGEALRVGRCWWEILLLGARGAKLKTTAGRERPPQPGSDRAQQLQGRASAMRQAQGEGGESPWGVQSRGIWSRAQLSHELSPPGLSCRELLCPGAVGGEPRGGSSGPGTGGSSSLGVNLMFLSCETFFGECWDDLDCRSSFILGSLCAGQGVPCAHQDFAGEGKGRGSSCPRAGSSHFQSPELQVQLLA